MVQLKDLLSNNSIQAATQMQLLPGAILLGPMSNVEHEKFYIIAGINQNKLCVCSVIINSEINQFIRKRPQLLARQLELAPQKYSFLSHTSYVNCAQPLKGDFQYFQNTSYKIVGTLDAKDLNLVQSEIIASGMLTEEEIEMYFSDKNR